MNIGLKGAWKRTKGCKLRHRISELYWDIRYAWQRVWDGYDNRDIFAMYDNFIERYKAILKDYKKCHYGLFNIPNEYKDVFNKDYFDENETNTIIDTMIFHLEMINEDYVEKLLYGKNVYDDDYDVSGYHKRCNQIYTIMDQNKNAFMKLFSTFFWQLWD